MAPIRAMNPLGIGFLDAMKFDGSVISPHCCGQHVR